MSALMPHVSQTAGMQVYICSWWFAAGSIGDPNGASWAAINDSILVDKPLIDMNIAKKAIESLRKYSKQALSGEKPFFIAAGKLLRITLSITTSHAGRRLAH